MLNKIKEDSSIICVYGEAGSGKTTFIHIHFSDCEVISISSIVKRLSGFETRKDLVTTSDLDEDIICVLREEISRNQSLMKRIVIDGIRQKSIFESLKIFTGVSHIWLDVPREIRKKRIEERNDKKDNLSFEDLDKMDAQLGLIELKECLIGDESTLIVKNYENE